jgi:hypothetical protein
MIHLVFNDGDQTTLQGVQALDPTLAGPVLVIKDDYAVGPLADMHTPEGWQNRRNWWQQLLEIAAEYPVAETMEMVQDKLTVHQVLAQLQHDPTEAVWIWAAQNKHDVCGYYWLTTQLRGAAGRVLSVYLNNLPFINEKGGLFYPTCLQQILPKELLKAKRLARPIAPSEFELDADEWARLCTSGSGVRLLEGAKKIVGHAETYYDAALADFVAADFQKGSKIVQQHQSKAKETTGDVFLLWRLKLLAKAGGWECRGDIAKAGKDFELRRAALAEAHGGYRSTDINNAKA